MFDVVTIGGATRDIYFRVKEGRLVSDIHNPFGQKLLAFPYGAKILPEKAIFTYGGGAANTAIGLSRLGLKVATCINLGEEGTGDVVSSNLKEAGVATSYITRDKSTHTAVSVIIGIEDGDRILFAHPGSNINLKIKNLDNLSKKTRWFYITSLRGDADKELEHIIRCVDKEKVQFCFNPGEEQLRGNTLRLKKIIEKASILILNKEEARELAIKINKDYSHLNIKDLIKTFRSFYSGVIIITSGKEGSHGSVGNEIIYQPAKVIKVVDSTGAGDAFGSGFLYGWIKTHHLRQALEIGSANAASVLAHFGSQEGLLDQKKLKKYWVGE